MLRLARASHHSTAFSMQYTIENIKHAEFKTFLHNNPIQCNK